MAGGIVNAPYDRYHKTEFLAKGCFGEVFKAIDRQKNIEVAVKRIFRKNAKRPNADMDKCIRSEISSLSKIKHENVIKLHGYLEHADFGGVDLVLDLCAGDLFTVFGSGKPISRRTRRIIAKQLFTGIREIHKRGILHRDLKSENILLTKEMVVKIADFGCSKFFYKEDSYGLVGSRCYMAPEVLLEMKHGREMDIWSAGVITAELWSKTYLFPAANKEDQLDKIICVCGSITTDVWPGVSKSPIFASLDLRPNCARSFKLWFKEYTTNDYALDLLDKIFVLDPSKRLKIEEILQHDFFKSGTELFLDFEIKPEPQHMNYVAAVKKNLICNKINKYTEVPSPTSAAVECPVPKPQQAENMSVSKIDLAKTRNGMVKYKKLVRPKPKPLSTINEIDNAKAPDLAGSSKEEASEPVNSENQDHVSRTLRSAVGNLSLEKPTPRSRRLRPQRKACKEFRPSKNHVTILACIPEETSVSCPDNHSPQLLLRRVSPEQKAAPQTRKVV